MVQVLVIRQAFMVIDLVLAAAIVVTAGLVTQRLFSTTSVITPAEAVADTEASAPEQTLSTIAARPEYDSILASGFFGEAGRWNPAATPAAPAPEPLDTTAEETTLNLKLLGVSALEPNDPLASAVIQDLDQHGGMAAAYWPGDQILENVSLLEVHPRMVILENRKNTPATRERLSMDEETPGLMAGNAPGPTLPSSIMGGNAPERIELNRQELMQELYVNYADLVTKLKPELKTDDQGNVIGLTADNIGQIPLAQKLGLQDNDVLQTINNEKIDSEQKIMEIMARYQNAGSFRIGVLRDGKAKVITYRLN
ncbi:MAG: hypothetical protein HYV26_08360 [Candidatus Hydrogenedentes bacterium]|nr:hypothetical protein [Candidatus Hydrogenedentota bacterium]